MAPTIPEAKAQLAVVPQTPPAQQGIVLSAAAALSQVAPGEDAPRPRVERDQAARLDPAPAAATPAAPEPRLQAPVAAQAVATFNEAGPQVEPGIQWRLQVEPAQLTSGLERAAPTPVAQALQTVPPQHLTLQVARAFDAAQGDRVEIRLDPPELGRVQIQLQVIDGGLQASVLAERPETHEFLRRHAEMLARELSEAGYENVSLDFAAGGQASPRDDDPKQQMRAFGSDAPMRPGPVALQTLAAPLARVAGSLDIRL